MEVQDMRCCGVRELHGLSRLAQDMTTAGAKAMMLSIKEQLTTGGEYETIYDYKKDQYVQGPWEDEVFHCPAIFVFTQAGNPTDVTAHGAYGDYFMAYIHEQGLGTVVDTEAVYNENSKNLIKLFTWTVNQDAFKAWTGGRKKKEAA